MFNYRLYKLDHALSNEVWENCVYATIKSPKGWLKNATLQFSRIKLISSLIKSAI